MKHFAYTYSEHTPRGGHTRKTVRLYVIRRNVPVFLGTMTDTFVDQNQLVMMAMQAFKALPAKAFDRHPSGGMKHTTWTLKEAGIATVHQL